MKFAIFFLYLHSPFETSYADEYINGYQRSDGNFVQGYRRTEADSNPYNNYSSPNNGFNRDFSGSNSATPNYERREYRAPKPYR